MAVLAAPTSSVEGSLYQASAFGALLPGLDG